jgi:hypothetical protein
MARGKYAARAANRLAEIDSGVVAELKEKLATVTAERDSARAEVDRLGRDLYSQTKAIADRVAQDRVQQLEEALLTEQRERAEDRRVLGRKFFEMWRLFDFKVPMAALEEFATLFGISDQIGALVAEGGKDNNRASRRTTKKKIRMIQDLEQRGIRL